MAVDAAAQDNGSDGREKTLQPTGIPHAGARLSSVDLSIRL